jgi:hypothetical protein
MRLRGAIHPHQRFKQFHRLDQLKQLKRLKRLKLILRAAGGNKKGYQTNKNDASQGTEAENGSVCRGTAADATCCFL